MSAAPDVLRVLFVIPGKPRGHSMIFARRQADALERSGIRIGRFYLRSRTNPRQLWNEVWRLRRRIRRQRPDIVHAQFGTVTGLLTAIVAMGTPVVISYRGSDLNPVPSEKSMRAGLGRWMSQLAALGASRIVCVSRVLRGRLWWRAGEAAVLPSGVDLELFSPGSRLEARRRLGWSAEAPVVLFSLGHGGVNKRLDLARAAFDRVRIEWPAAELRIMDGFVAPSLVPDWMRAADCLLLTSDSEGSPNVVREALATNLPVVSVDVGDAGEWLAGVTPGSICARNPVALAAAVGGVLGSAQRSNGRQRAEAFSLERLTAEWSSLYRGLVPRPSSKHPQWNTTSFSPRSRS